VLLRVSDLARSFSRLELADSARTLAALRIAVALTLLVSSELYQSQEALTRALANAAPEGLGFLAAGLPTLQAHPGWWRLVEVLACSSAATLLLGYWSRLSSLVLTLSAGLVCAVSELGGAVLHNMHLFWLTLLCAVSRSGDAWSLDGWGRALPAPSAEYGVPLTFARALLGAVYFFPGLHKLVESGPHWLAPSNIAGHMHGKWFQTGWVPLLRIDDVPALCILGGVFVVAFELCAPLLFLVRRFRTLGFACAIGFHLATDLLLQIRFISLMTCTVILLPWDRLASRLGRKSNVEPAPISMMSLGPGLVVGSLLLVAVVQAGIRAETQAWPFGCYPTFAHTLGSTAIDLNLRLEYSSGDVLVTGRPTIGRTELEWRRVYFLLGSYPAKPSRADLERHGLELYRTAAALPDPRDLERATLVRAEYLSAPEHWGKPPVYERVVVELPLSLIREAAPRSGSRAPRAGR